jgi:hypothetical protein
MDTYKTIPIPIHPDDKDLPPSLIRLRLPSGKVASLYIPLQGEKTLDNAIKTLELWKPTLVVTPDYAI